MTMNNNNANLGALISMVHKHGLYLVGGGHRIYSGSRRDSDSREHQHINLQGAPRGFPTGTFLPVRQDGHCLNGLERSVFHVQSRVQELRASSSEIAVSESLLPLYRVSLCPEEWSLLGVEARDDPLSVLSELELRCCCSEPALEVTVEEEVEEERVFSLKSVMMTVTLPTVIASCWAELRSMFFSLGLACNRETVQGGVRHIFIYYCLIYYMYTILWCSLYKGY